MRPHVRTWRSMERRGGRDSGKSVNGAMFGVVTRHFVVWAQTAHSSRTGRVHSTSDAICTARRPRMAGVRGAGPSKTGKRGAKQRTVVPKTWTNCGSGMRCEFLGVNVRFLAREDGCPPPAFSCSPSKKATLIYKIYGSPIHQVQGPCGAYTQYTSIKIAYVSLTVVSSHFSAAQT